MKFTKPKGSIADLREIEYISALHQTGEELRKDGSINAADIKMFLVSRYGIVVTEKEVNDTIMKGFGGGGISEADGDNMDLTELVAMLMIPTLVKTKKRMDERNAKSNAESFGGASGVSYKPNEYPYSHGNIVDDFENNSPREHSATTIDFGHNSSRQGDSMMINSNESFVVRDDSQAKSGTKKLFQFVLQMILADAIHNTSSSPPPLITIDLLRSIFLFYGEKDVAADTELLESMVQLAQKSGDTLDDRVFAYCCTSDVELYNCDWEQRISSTYVDVFETHKSTKKNGQKTSRKPVDDEEVNLSRASEGGETESVNEVLKKYTFPSIDYAVDTFRSKTYVILLWFCWVLFFMNFFGALNRGNPEKGNMHCEQYDITTPKGFWCRVGQGVVNWLKFMFKLVTAGSIFVIGASVGHSTSPHHPLLVLISVIFISLYTFIPLANEWVILPSSDGVYSEFDSTKSYDDYNLFLACGQFSVGAMLLLFCVQNILDRTLSESFLDKHQFFKQILASGSTFMEKNMKKAGTFKVNRMINNALDIHDAAATEENLTGKESMYGRALLSYSKISDATEEIGGHWWTWNGLRTGRLFEEEGIWLSNRVMQGNLGQLFLCVLLIPMTIWLAEYVRLFYEILFSVFEFPIPAQWRIIVPIIAGSLFAELNCLGLVTVYIPSSIRTTFRFRYGAIGSLHDPDFQKMRKNVEQSTFIFGSMFWGAFLSNVLVLSVAWCLATLACLPQFLPGLLALIATMIGLTITILIKMILLMAVRFKFSGTTFYRSSPAAANFIGVLLEAWNLGISVLFVFIRMVTLVFTAFLYVARVDIPFLSDSADEVGGYVIDRWPFVFRKDMLQHEAHRHPYLERIGVMYMMKLRYGDRFGNEAGTSWRLLFVYALFPWLRKYRIRGEEANEVTTGSNIQTKYMNIQDNADVTKDDIAILTSQAKEANALRKKVKRMESEIEHLSACLQEANTRADA